MAGKANRAPIQLQSAGCLSLLSLPLVHPSSPSLLAGCYIFHASFRYVGDRLDLNVNKVGYSVFAGGQSERMVFEKGDSTVAKALPRTAMIMMVTPLCTQAA
jgi:hypothetical protein